MRVPRIRHRGTTIIELVMAIVILGVGLPPLMMAFAESARQSIEPVNATIASFLATERMENVIARRYKNSAGYDAVTAANFPAEIPVAGFTGFNRTVTFAELDSALNASGAPLGYRLVTVTVTWNGGANEISIDRLFSDF